MTQETLLHVTGMTCNGCTRHVDRALRELDGVANVEVRLREGEVRVWHDRSRAPAALLIDAIREAGYEVTP